MNHSITKIFLCSFFLCLLLSPSLLFARTDSFDLLPVEPEPIESWIKPIDAENLWQLSRNEMILRANPKVISALFYSLVYIKGNKHKSITKINSEILKCDAKMTESHSCYIDRLQQAKRIGKIDNLFISPFNILHIKKLFHRKGLDIVRLTWAPIYTKPAYWTVKNFLLDLQIVKETKYYKVKNNIALIQIVPKYSPFVYVVLQPKIRRNLQRVYAKIKESENDRIFLFIDHAGKKQKQNILTVQLYMSPKKIKINAIEMKVISWKQVKEYKKLL